MDYSKIGWIRRRSLIVEMTGLFIGAANTTMFTLPVGYRPYNKNMVAGAICVDLMSGGANNMFDAVIINTDGTVKSGGNPGGYSVPGWSLLSGVRYPIVPPEVAP